ncbi:unnamed protein product [Fusarium graminearum]|uniref:Uncharacterized protein n=1 Tax=Gibberella zeae TaxID=5518 RepID=A0A9N8NHY0_GIBZA|nr:unnamed protein product [Fusarium graminearum]CAG1976799.1 unnamed protein product [Fusarium graminearum]CAG1994345.1 unnamed protein product [Fusarium graminearum]
MPRRPSPSMTPRSRFPNNKRRRRRNARPMGPSASRAVVMVPRLFLVMIPLLPLLRRRTQIEARANDPEKEENPKDGTNDNPCNCAGA